MKNNDKDVLKDARCTNRKEGKCCSTCKKSAHKYNRNPIVKEPLFKEVLNKENSIID